MYIDISGRKTQCALEIHSYRRYLYRSMVTVPCTARATL